MRINKRKFSRSTKDTYIRINLESKGKGLAWIAGTVLVVLFIGWVHQGFNNRANTHRAEAYQRQATCKRIAAGKTYYVHLDTLSRKQQVCTVVSGPDALGKTDYDL